MKQTTETRRHNKNIEFFCPLHLYKGPQQFIFQRFLIQLVKRNNLHESLYMQNSRSLAQDCNIYMSCQTWVNTTFSPHFREKANFPPKLSWMGFLYFKERARSLKKSTKSEMLEIVQLLNILKFSVFIFMIFKKYKRKNS